MNLTKTGIVLVAFILGCGAGGFASQLAIPSARAGASFTRWEYFCLEGRVDDFNRAGAQGWELTTAMSVGWYCFKRPLPSLIRVLMPPPSRAFEQSAFWRTAGRRARRDRGRRGPRQ